MLVLTRRKDESIVLHGGPLTTPIEIMVITLGDRVRLGITATPDVQIDRKEVLESPDYRPRTPKGNR